MDHPRTAIVLVLTLLLAGCLQDSPEDGSGSTPPPDEKDEERPGEPPTENDGPPPMEDGNATYPMQAHWTDCEGVLTSFDWPGPPPHAPEPPPEWQEDVPLGAGILMQELDCTRFSLGDFERPVHMFMEWMNYQEAPEDCWRDNTTYIPYTLTGIWVNDTEVADYLSQTYGITTYVAEFESEEASPATGREVVWRMHHDGNTSTMNIQISNDRTTHSDLKQRLYWFPPWGGVGYMDWDVIEYESDAIAVMPARGHFEPPLLMAEWPTEYTDTGQFTEDGIYSAGEIRLFKDVLCKEPW